MEAMRKILEAINMEVGGIMADWSDPRSECREILRLTAQALALSSPHPEAREEDDLAADEARVWQALNVGKGMAEALNLSGDSYSAGDWEDTKAGYGRLLESFRSRLAAPKPEGREEDIAEAEATSQELGAGRFVHGISKPIEINRVDDPIVWQLDFAATLPWGEEIEGIESEGSWFLIDQRGKVWEYGPMKTPAPLGNEYTRAIPLLKVGDNYMTWAEIRSRLAAPKPEGQAFTVEQVGWLRVVLGRALYRVEHFPEQSNDEGIEADELAKAIILLGGQPATPEPRLAAQKDEGPSNNPETPDGSPRDCDTCRHWGGWSKNCGFCHNRSKWEGRSAPKPAPVVSHDAADTIHNAGSVSHDNREPDGRKGE